MKSTHFKYVRPMSDLHMDEYFDPFTIPHTDVDHKTVLVLAGDVAEKHAVAQWELDMTNRFHSVVRVLGNHEYYKGNTKRMPEKLLEKISNLNGGTVPSNYHLLDMAEVVIDDTVFIGATLWTDYNNGNQMEMLVAKNMMNDFKKIRTGPSGEPWKFKFKPQHAWSTHQRHLEYIKLRTKHWEDSGKKIVVVTHHAPSSMSIHPRFKGHATNSSYYSDLSETIYNREIDLWVHGHVHNRFDYNLPDSKTRVVCNPRGYCFDGGREYEDFDPLFNISLGD